jgi:predicted DNA-binding transcriptional regulator AlpA
MYARIWMMQRKEVCKAFGTSSAGLHRGMIDGRYPRPYRTGLNSVRWKSDEVQGCIDKFPVAVPIEVAPGIRKGRKASATRRIL